MKFIAYTRVSTQKQERSGLGLEAQAASIQRYIALASGELIDTVVEVESGSQNARPGLQRALALCRKHRATLLIARLDRLGRRLSFLATLLEADVELAVADSPGASKLTLQLLAVVAEAERDLIRQRTKEALAAAKARGVVLGRHSQILAAKAIEEAKSYASSVEIPIKDIIAAGARSIRAVARELNERGVKSREGGVWGPSNTARVLRRLEISLSV